MATQTANDGGAEEEEPVSRLKRKRPSRKSSGTKDFGASQVVGSGGSVASYSAETVSPGEAYGVETSEDPRADLRGGHAAAAGQDETDIIYRLELAQQPTRGRTCGFGDADRRALSAPLIARLRMYDPSDGSELDIDSVDIAFLICAADLWSSDGSEEMNLVHHPAYHHARPTGLSVSPMSNHIQLGKGKGPPPPVPPAAQPSYCPGLAMEAEGYPMASTSVSEMQPSDPYSYPRRMDPRAGNADESSHPPPLPPISSSSHPAASSQNVSPTFSTFAFQAPYHNLPHPPSMEAVDLSRRQWSQASTSTLPPRTGSSSGMTRPWTAHTNRPSTAATSISIMTAGSIPPPLPPPSRGEARAAPSLETEYACVKNLVGALTTNGHLLKAPGEAEAGIFFVFHDLSVRTEGTFTLRLRLASIGSLATGLSTGSIPVLCEVFTQPFEVMSAKKFPGMLDPTPLSQAFAKQGLRIPTRKGANRKRLRTSTLSIPGEASQEGESTPMPEEAEDERNTGSPS